MMTNKALQQYVHRSIDAWIQKTGIDNAQKFNDTHDVLYPILEIIPFLSFVNDDSLTHDEKLKQGRIKKRIAIRELIKEYQSSKDSNFHWDILFVTLMKGRVLDFSDRETIYKAACDKKDAFLANIISSQPLFIHAKPAQVLSNIQLEPQAHDETLKVIEEYRTNNLRAVLHCFSGDLSIARTVYQWGYALGIGGTVTYPKNNDLRAVCTELPLDAFVLETDAPYLPPQGFRGTQNSPAHILTIAHYIAELRHESLEEIATNTTKRARILFNIS